MTQRPTLTVLMPVYNERATVERALADALGADYGVDGVQLVVVDDGSTDGTRELLSAWEAPPNAVVRFHDRNRGKGAALRTGLADAQGEFTAILDADLEYEAASIRTLLGPLLAGDARVVYGVRGFESHSAYNFWYVIGNKAVTFAANLIYNSWVSDIMTCHKVLPTELFRSLPLRERGFAIEPEITARLLQRKIRIYEVPVTYNARQREEGKKLTATDGLRVVRTLLRCRVDGR